MRNLICVYAVLLTLVSCANTTEVEDGIIGKWKVIQTLVDPGDGSGSFRSVKSDKTITFKSDNKVISNRSLSSMFSSENLTSTGIYSMGDSTITITGDVQNLHFKLENSVLIIYHPCIEGCAEKLTKIF